MSTDKWYAVNDPWLVSVECQGEKRGITLFLGDESRLSDEDRAVLVERAAFIANALNGSRPEGANTPALQALADIKWDVHHCDWRCEVCGNDYEMKETDIACTLRDFEKENGALPEPYGAGKPQVER